jgi:hypothetical protein
MRFRGPQEDCADLVCKVQGKSRLGFLKICASFLGRDEEIG